MPITKEQISELKQKMYNHVKEHGPVIPVHLTKIAGSSTIFTGAVLSEMVSQKQVKVTNAKIGGSPMYYCHGQEEKIEMLREYLGQRPKQAFDLIKEQKILHDRSCEPWQRVALREIKDFALPITIEINGTQEIFWRWHLLPEDEAVQEIKKAVEEQEKNNGTATEAKKTDLEQKNAAALTVDEVKEVTQKVLSNNANDKAVKKPRKKREKKSDDAFYRGILQMFSEREIDIVEQKILKPGKEFNFIVKVPSNLGELNYLAIAKAKKKVNDSDITMAFSEGINSKMPVMFLSQGELSKKAQKFLASHMKGVLFKKI